MGKKQELIKLFENPTNEYRGKPFWSWNGELDKEELLRQLSVIKEMGLGGFFIHSRAGLMTEYLGEEWFDLVNAVTDEGEKLGLESWLYDEDRWPSGSAGGKVTVDPQYRQKSIVMYGYDREAFEWNETVAQKTEEEPLIAVFAAALDGLALYEYTACATETELKAALAQNERFNKILVFRIVTAKPESVYNGTTYIDVMSRKAVDRFIELTHQAYQEHCGDRIGTSIKGIFTDEPHRGHMLDDYRVEDGVMICSAAYTDDIFEEFEKRYGYDLKPILPELYFRKNGRKVAKVKLDFVDLGNNLFIERFADPIKEWCDAHNMAFTGHVLHEDSFANQTVPNGSVMRFYQHMTYPGVDLLTEPNRCYWVVKQISSAARQVGQKWLMSELYGCTGWQLDFKAHKAVGDWQALLGINLRCHHLSWYTMEGESKRDYPGSIFHQSPYYKDYGFVETYFARFGAVMMQGNPVCDVLVMNAIESAWAMIYPGWSRWVFAASDNQDEQALEKHYLDLFHMMMGTHIDFDYGEEYMMKEMYRVDHDETGRAILRVGNASYRCVVVSGMITMRASTVQILREFLDAGGTVIFSGELPAYVDAADSEEPARLAAHPNAVQIPFESAALGDAVRKVSGFYTEVTAADETAAGNIFLQTRYDDETGMMYTALINADRDHKIEHVKLAFRDCGGLFSFCEKNLFAEHWDLASGERFAQELTFENGVPVITFDLDAAGEKVFVFTREQDPTLKQEKISAPVRTHKLPENSAFSYTLDEKNVCVLDFATWKFNGGEWQPEDEVLRIDAKIRDLAGIEHRSGNMLQPWYTKKHCNDAYGEVEVEYEFYVDVLPEGEVFLAGERPEFCNFYLNGTQLHCQDPADFWIDICFKKLAVPAGLLKQGKNVVTYKTLFKRTTNIEALYLVGDFGVRLEGHKRILDTLPETIGFRNLCEYRLPFYTGCVTYRIPNARLNVSADAGQVLLRTDGYRGSLVKVAPADGSAEPKILAWEPYEADITEWAAAGRDIDVTLVCSRRNMFGPLHLVPAEFGVYGPEHFVTTGAHWSDDYALINSSIYGITIEERK